jgi:uncharacterized protein (TIGR02996 family)
LQAVWDDPDDTAAALIYADWLSDNGGSDEQDLADFIRVQVRLEGGDEADLKKREKALLSKHRKSWLKDVPTGLRGRVSFVRGFVRRVRTTASRLAVVGDELGRHYPISEVDLEGNFPRKSVASLAVLEFWKRVRVLKMPFSAKDDPTAFELFFRNIHLRQIQTLAADCLALGPRGVAVLAKWPGLAAVRGLSLCDDGLTRHCIEMLFASPHLGPLRRLSMAANSLDSASAGFLAAQGRLACLEELSLYNNDIGPAGVKALAASPHMANLKHLHVAGNPVTDAGAWAVVDGFPALTVLHLSTKALGAEVMKKLRARFGKGLYQYLG